MRERERERLRGLGVLLGMKVSEHEDGEGKQGELYILQRRRKKMLTGRWICICQTVVYADRIKNWLKEPVYLLLLFF